MLSIPGSSCECERLFSELGDLLEPRRRSISPQLLAAIQCDRRWIRARFGSGEVPVKEAISDEEMDAKYANPSEPSELLASAQLAEQANWLSSLSLLIDICDDETQADHLIIKSRLENEDLSWMDRLPRNWQRTVLTIDNDFAKLHEGAKRVDRGRVADVYLRWIIENYNKLPEVIVFLPPENQPRTSGQHIRSEIPKLRARSIQSSGFAPLKCPEVEMCEKLVHPFRSPPYEIRTLDEPMGNVWKQIFGDAKMGGEDLAASPSAEFAVSKAQVQKRSVDEYLKAWTWLNRTPMDDDSAGLVLEYLWPFLFGRDALFCPDFKEV
ncbi:repeatmulti-domain protein [Pyrenophora tritici-repentis]|nr:repeatmulti-domain protein [Pyrenophora tritici-repentis]